MPTLQGRAEGGDFIIQIENEGTVLAEVDKLSYTLKQKIDTFGSGLGYNKDDYARFSGPPQLTGKMSRPQFSRANKGSLFSDLVMGVRNLITEEVAVAATTYTLTTNAQMFTLVELRLKTSGKALTEGLDYTVNYATGVITFAVSTPEIVVVRYGAQSRNGQQFLLNGGFEDPLTNLWTTVATATIARNSVAANVFADGYALAVTPVAANDGIQYNQSLVLVPGRQYRLRLRAKAAGAETLVGKWYDGASLQTMSPASVTLSTTYALYEFTFTATKSVVPYLQIIDSKASPGLFYIDEVQLIDDSNASTTTANVSLDLMDAALAHAPFLFNIVVKRLIDGVIAFRFNKSFVTDWGGDGDKAKGWSEDISFQTLSFFKE